MDRIVVRDVIVGVIVAVIGGLIVTMVTAFTMHVHALELFSLVGVIVVVCAFLIVLLYSRYSPSVQPPPQPDAASPSPSVVKVLSLGVKGCLSVAALAVIGVVATIGLGIILGSQSNNNNGNNNNPDCHDFRHAGLEAAHCLPARLAWPAIALVLTVLASERLGSL